MKIKLDEKDKKILRELQLDARQNYSSIAKKVKISKEAVRYRIKRLEKLKIIEKYTMMLNATKIGQKSFRWYIQLENTSKEKLMEIVNSLKNNPYCIWVATCAGQWDIIAVFSVYSSRHFDEITSKFLFDYSGYVRGDEFVIALDVYFFKTELFGTYEFESIKTVYWGGDYENKKLDKTEILILKELCANPTIKIIDIARKYKLSFEIVKNRIKKMEKSGLIQGASIFINYKILGLESYKLFFNLKRISKKKEKEFLEYLHFHKNIAETIRCIGNWNMEINIVVKDSSEYYNLMLELKDKFSGIIKSYSTIQVFNNYKYNLFPMAEELLKKLNIENTRTPHQSVPHSSG